MFVHMWNGQLQSSSYSCKCTCSFNFQSLQNFNYTYLPLRSRFSAYCDEILCSCLHKIQVRWCLVIFHIFLPIYLQEITQIFSCRQTVWFPLNFDFDKNNFCVELNLNTSANCSREHKTQWNTNPLLTRGGVTVKKQLESAVLLISTQVFDTENHNKLYLKAGAVEVMLIFKKPFWNDIKNVNCVLVDWILR